jgi:hypothetical protein
VTTSRDGILLNTLQASSMLPHFAYMSTKLFTTRTSHIDPNAIPSRVAEPNAISLSTRTWREKHGRLPREKQIYPRSSTRPGRQNISPFCSAAYGRRPPATGAPLPACPGTAALRFALCPSLSQSLELCVCLCRVGLGTKWSWWEDDGNKKIFVGPWRKQKEFDGNLMKTKGFWQVTDGNKRDFLGTWWEQKDFDGLLMKTRGIWWELFETWWEQKDFDRLLKGTVWEVDMKSSP